MGSDEHEIVYTRLWMAAQPAVASLLVTLVRDHAAVDDLLQEVALAAYQHLERYDRGRSFTGWVLGIARHKALDHLRRHRGGRRELAGELAERIAAAAEALEHDLPRRELALHDCLARLPDRSRSLVRWHYGEDRPMAEIAVLAELTVGNVKVLLHRIRGHLRRCIDARLASTSPEARP